MTDFLVADYAIRQLHARYIDAIWKKDVAAFSDCFAEDAEWKIAGMHVQGRAGIGSTFEKLISPSERVLMFIGTPVLDIGHRTATGRVYMTEYIKRLDGNGMRTIGAYDDHYIGDGLDWRFQSRHLQLHYRGPADLSEPFLDSP